MRMSDTFVSVLNLIKHFPSVADFRNSSSLAIYSSDYWRIVIFSSWIGEVVLELRHRKFDHMPWFRAHHHHWPFNLVCPTSFPTLILSPSSSMGNSFLILRRLFQCVLTFSNFSCKTFLCPYVLNVYKLLYIPLFITLTKHCIFKNIYICGRYM